MKSYQTKIPIFKESTVDDYEHGESSRERQVVPIDIQFKGDTVKEVVKEIKEFHCVSDDYLLIEPCGETGRVDVMIMEDRDGIKMEKGDRNYQQWVKGEKTLWSAIYTYYVQEVRPASLS